MNNQSYQVVNATYYHADTPAAVIEVLEKARKGGFRIRLCYGDTETGRDWLDEFSVEGTIFGLPADEYRELADALRDLGVPVGETVIPSIRSIVQVQ